MATPFIHTTRALALDRGRPALLAWGVAALGLLAWGAWFIAGQVTLVEVSRQARLEVVQAPHPLAPARAGLVAESRLVVGQAVQAGEVLLVLDTSAARLQLAEAEAQVKALPLRLAALQAEFTAQQAAQAADQAAAVAANEAAQARGREASAAAAFAADEAQRLAAEAARGSVPEIDALRAAAQARKLKAGEDAALAELRREALDARTRAEQGRVQLELLRRAQATLAGELAGAQAAQARLAQAVDSHQVRAPVAGVLAEVQAVRPGSYVAEGQRLATLVPAGELRVVADFDPAGSLGRLRPGQTARLRLDGWPWAQYGSVPARVLRVAGELRDGLLHAELALQGTLPAALTLQHGQAGVVEVEVESTSPAQLALRAAGRALEPAR